MKKILALVITLFILGFTQSFAADWLITPGGSARDAVTSGVLDTTYTITWCPAHVVELGLGCQTSVKFQDIGAVATLPIDGLVGPDIDTIIDGMDFKIIGEGELTINTYITDNANNVAKKEFIYKIDKTAPKFGDIVFTEASPYIYAEETENRDITLIRNHVATGSTNDLPNRFSDYIDDNASEKFLSATIDIQKVRYKDIPSQNINIKLDNTNDDYDDVLSTLVSGLQKIEFLYNTTLITTNNTPNLGQDLDSTEFNVTPDNGKNINVRLYDNAGNYSEKAFYVYRDETDPDLSDFVFNFSGDTAGLKQSGTQDSRFILANNDTKIEYDWGVSNTANNHMSSEMTIKVEKFDDSNLINGFQEDQLNNISGETTQFILSDVDYITNDITAGNYRNYSVQFETEGITGNKICDAVGNCIDGSTVLKNLRVMAGPIANDKSTLSITPPATAIANNPANPLVDRYNVGFRLRDQFDNTIRQVTDGVTQIKKVSSDFDFTNGLVAAQTPYNTALNNSAVTIGDLVGGEITSTNINDETDPQLILEETNDTSDGDFEFTLSSKVPTVGGYQYMKSSATLSLDNIQNEVSYTGSTLVYNGTETNPIINFTGDNWLTINFTINEDQTDRYNVANNLSSYGVLLGTYTNTPLSSNAEKLNFEFGSPFIYHAENFNILRDGINSKHEKMIQNNNSGIGTYKLVEQYFDVVTRDNSRADFYVNNGTTPQNNTKEITSINIEDEYEVKYNAKSGQDFDKWGYVSYLGYAAGTGYTYIPSISRGVEVTANNLESPSAYPLTGLQPSLGGTSFLTKDISISGLVNKIEGGANTNVGDQSGLVSLDMKRPYTRAELLQKVKKKMVATSRGLEWCIQTDFDMNNPDSKCSTIIQGEEISFYEGDIIIPAATITNRRAIIVKNGRVTIAGNLNTNNTNGQLLIVSVTDQGLENISINTDNANEDKQKGWIAIKQNVTNIDAFLLSQGPLVTSSVSSDDIFINYTLDDKLLDQLHIYGSVFSLNTIGGSKTGTCPYIEQNCLDGDTSKIYDLSFLRRYTRVNAGNFGGTNGAKVPYSPNLELDQISSLTTESKSSGGLQYYGNGVASSSTTLRTAQNEHLDAPVIIERDNRWTISPSFFAKD